MRKLRSYERAIQYVRAHADDELDAETRLDFMLTGARPPDFFISFLSGPQKEDGGYAALNDKTYTSIETTCVMMAVAERIGLDADDEPIKRMIQFLLGRQREDGHFCEEESFAEAAPFWSRPGNLSGTLYQTAHAGYWLALFGQRAAATRAAMYLSEHLDIIHCELPTTSTGRWLAAGLWWQLGMTGSAECLFKKIRHEIPDMLAADCGLLLSRLLIASVPRDHWLVDIAVDFLEEEQEADGSFGGYSDEEVCTTLDVLRALILVYGNPE